MGVNETGDLRGAAVAIARAVDGFRLLALNFALEAAAAGADREAVAALLQQVEGAIGAASAQREELCADLPVQRDVAAPASDPR